MKIKTLMAGSIQRIDEKVNDYISENELSFEDIEELKPDTAVIPNLNNPEEIVIMHKMTIIIDDEENEEDEEDEDY